MKVGINRVHALANPKNKVKGFVDIIIEDVLVIKSLKVVENKSGELFVSMPQDKGKDDKYYDQVRPLNKEVRDDITQTVLAGFAKEVKA